MAEIKGPGKEPTEKRKFINEKIVKQPMTRRQMARRAAAFLFLAVLFGVIAAVTFVLSEPAIGRLFGKETPAESQTISIPKDEETTAPMETTTPEVEEETAALSELVKDAIEKYHFSMQNVSDIHANLKQLGHKANRSIVTVRSVKKETDWFDNPIESAGQYAGAIIAVTDGEILVLAPEAAVETADAIFVTFHDGTDAEAVKKQTDKITGLSVISVKKDTVAAETLAMTEAFKLGNSYAVKSGDLIFSVGAPAGMPYSFDYGTVTYVAKNVQKTDGVTRIMFADVQADADSGTFLMNAAGEIIGWVTDKYMNETNEKQVIAEGISDYKGILEKMSNGMKVAYIGIKGQDITDEMAEKGMPAGIYVYESVPGGPAYAAGIQNGDILTEMDGEKLFTMKDLQSRLEQMETGQTVKIAIKRNGREEAYTDLEYQVTAGER